MKLKTGRAYAIKESFRDFWSQDSPAEVAAFFKHRHNWVTHSRLDPVIKVAKMLKSHFDRILTHFTLRATNAIAEGINNKIQTIKKKAYGFRNVQRFINMIYFHCGSLELHPLQFRKRQSS